VKRARRIIVSRSTFVGALEPGRCAIRVVLTLFACSGIVAVAALRAAGQDASSLRDRFIRVRTIDPVDEDFSDLLPLVEKIGRARVVVLGEATHGEGTTSRAKVRMVRFLHEIMGFDVLAWESGLVQVYGMNTALRDPDVPLDEAKAYLMSGGWAAEEATRSLFEYARESWKTDRPLEMAGVDLDRPHRAAPCFMSFLSDLRDRAPSLAISDADLALVNRLVTRAFGFLSPGEPPDEERAQQRAVLVTILRRLREEGPKLRARMSERDLKVAERFLQHALSCEELASRVGAEWNSARDRAMASNLFWLATELYPDRKLIVWAATAHFIRNSSRITNPEHEDWYVSDWEAGNHVVAMLDGDLYTIAFTAYAGSQGSVFPEGARFETSVEEMVPAPDGSFEAVAHEIGVPYGFIDLRGVPPNHWLAGEYTSVALGRLVNSAPWSEVVDAFFFVDLAEPIHYGE